MTRREFVAGTAAFALEAAPPKQPVVCVFSKPFVGVAYEGIARAARGAGYDGVDLTVRPKGHVLPERVTTDLPRAAEIIRGQGLLLPMITTELTSASHPSARPILATAARLKIPFFKPGYWPWQNTPVEKRVAEVARDFAGLVALADEYGIDVGYHNHSGDNVGCAVWDIREILKGIKSPRAGYYFDPAHATVEGGFHNFVVSQELALSRIKMAALKDFFWERREGRWQVRWCPMGQGMVDWDRVFKAFAAARFQGPFTVHVEYEPPDVPAAITRDREFIRKQLAKAYGNA